MFYVFRGVEACFVLAAPGCKLRIRPCPSGSQQRILALETGSWAPSSSSLVTMSELCKAS